MKVRNPLIIKGGHVAAPIQESRGEALSTAQNDRNLLNLKGGHVAAKRRRNAQ